MGQVLEWLHGKKAIIIGICGVVIVYLMKESLIDENLAMALQAILTLLGGGADVMTMKRLGTTRK